MLRAQIEQDLAAEISRLETKVAQLEQFVCHNGGLVNEWAKSCPFGMKLTEHIKGELYEWLRRN